MRIYFIFNEMRMSKFLFIFNVNSGMKQGGGEGKETRSGTEKRCSHNLQSGHPARKIAVLFPRSEPAEEIRNAY